MLFVAWEWSTCQLLSCLAFICLRNLSTVFGE